jgi:hypothetical protein
MSDQQPPAPGFLNKALIDLTQRVEQLEGQTRNGDKTSAKADLTKRIDALEAAVARLRRSQARENAEKNERRPWHTLTAEEAEQRWTKLRDWVHWLIARNDIGAKEIPGCWYIHNGLVDELEALRWAWLDANRPDAKGTEPLWWREAFGRTRLRLPLYNPGGCGTNHSPTTARSMGDQNEWDRFLTHDLAPRPRRRQRAS